MKTYALYNDLFFRKKPRWMPLKLYRVVCQRANPRSRDQMLALLSKHYPQATLIDDQTILEKNKAQEIIFLYPDSIGLGWSSLERKYIKEKSIMVLNGRRRSFKLTLIERKRLLVKRFLEITFLPELFLSPCLLLAGSILALKDKLEGHS